jgi:hypothetical protein
VLVRRSLVGGSTTAPVRKGADNEQAATFIGWLCLGADPPWVVVQAHIFIAFLAYCLHLTLARRLHAGVGADAALEKSAAVQMIDVYLPTMDGRELALDRKLRGCDLVRLQVNDVVRRRPSPGPRHCDSAENRQTGPVRNHRTNPSSNPRLGHQ